MGRDSVDSGGAEVRIPGIPGRTKSRAQDVALTGMAAAVVAVSTSVLKVPMLATGGYLNLGDVTVIFLALMLGPRAGALAGGIGSAAADVVGGYGAFAGITFVAKGCEGWIAAHFGGVGASPRSRALGAVLAGTVMAGWYLLWEFFLVGRAPALASLPGNLLQGWVGALGGLGLYRAATTQQRRAIRKL